MNNLPGGHQSATPPTVRDFLEVGYSHHQAGRLQQAARLYQAILDQEPSNFDALHLMGLVALQTGNAGRAVDLIGRAVTLNPSMPEYHGNLGVAYQALGQLDRAANCCRLALQLNPDYVEAKNCLAEIALSQGSTADAGPRVREVERPGPDSARARNKLGAAAQMAGNKAAALSYFREAVQMDPNLADARSNLGQSLLEGGQVQEALLHCEEAVRLCPTSPEALNHLGNVLRKLGRRSEAVLCYVQALQFNPNLAVIYDNLAHVLHDEGRRDDAVVWLRQAVAVEPTSARYKCNLANVLAEQHKPEAALYFQAALAVDPRLAEAHYGLGLAHQDQGRLQEARTCLQEAVRVKPDFANAYATLGNVLTELGELEAALASSRTALRFDPRLARPYALMASILGGRMPDDDLEAMRRLIETPDLAEDQRSGLHFGLARVLDDRGAYDQVAEHLRCGNAEHLAVLQKRRQVYDLDFHRRLVDGLIHAFTPEYFSRVRGFGLQTERPVFIVGLPRSGSTLVEQILASHSQVFGAGEQRFVPESFDSLPAIMGRAQSPLACLAEIDRETVRKVAQRHLAKLDAVNAQAPRIVDKLLDNHLALGLIVTLFPQAKLIHCRRDLRDTALSCWMTRFTDLHWAFDQDHIAIYIREYRRIMEHWGKVLPQPILHIDYENMVADLEGTARRLVDWCGLTWEPACLEFHKTRRAVRTASLTQVRKPIYSNSIGRWKNYEKALARLFTQL
jgi:Flp pilus assembly protein TadD